MTNSLLFLGGNGFIGRALARKLIESGYKIHIIARRDPALGLRNVEFHASSLDNAELLEQLISQSQAIIHCANTCTPFLSANAPEKEGEENLMPLFRLLRILSQYKPRHLIYISSGGTVYGNPANLPVTEENILSPISYHGAAKAAAEHFLQSFSYSGYPVTILRPSNIYGPGQALSTGFGAVRTILHHLQHASTMEVWGEGKTLRDYLYIDDFVSATEQVLKQNVTGTFNVGAGEGYSLNELIRLAQEATGRELTIVRKPPRTIDVKDIVLDSSRLNNATGWNPSVQFKEGLRRTWEWVLQQP